MRTIVGSSTKKTKEIKTERIVDLGAIKSGVPTNVSQYGVAGSDIKELETAKNFASKAEKSAKEASSSAGKAEDFYELTKDTALGVQDNIDDSFKYLEEIRATSIKIGGQEANIDEAEKQVILHTTAAENAAQITSDSATSARASEANSAASASSASVSAATSSTKAKEASTSATHAANSALAASNSAAAALISERAAKTSETNSKASKDASALSASAANISEGIATTAKNQAKISATTAANSATAALTAKTQAETSATSAANSASAALASKNATATSATNAAGSAATASTKAGEASSSASSALASKNAAALSNASATASKVASKASEDAAKVSELAAYASELGSSANAVEADASESAAKTSEVNSIANATASYNYSELARGYANAAEISKGESQTAAEKADNSADESLLSANAAKASELIAKASEVASKASETAAKASATASKASELAAKASETTANTKAVQTAANAVTTAGHVTQTANNAALAETAKKVAEAAASTIVGGIVDKGAWDASTGVFPAKPTRPLPKGGTALVSGFWKVTVAGTAGGISFLAGDDLRFSAGTDTFYKIDNTDAVASVQGKTGAVVLAANEVGALATPTGTHTVNTVLVAGATSGTSKHSGFTLGKSVPSNAVFTDTVYTHPTNDGNLHIPATGTTNNGKALIAGATAGSAAWKTLTSSDISGLGAALNAKLDATANAVSATKLQKPITVNGIAFDGSANITISANSPTTLTRGTGLTGANYNGASATTWAVAYGTAAGTACQGNDARLGDARTPLAHSHVWADVTGKPTTLAGYGITDAPTKTGVGASGSWGISVTGNAATATRLATARTVNGVNFDGTANITIADSTKLPLTGGTVTGIINAPALGVNNTVPTTGAGISLYGSATTNQPSYGFMFAGPLTFGTHGGVTGDWATYFTMTGAATRGWIFKHGAGATGNVASISSAGVITASSFVGALSGNSTTATTLQTARTLTIGSTGKTFNGSANASWSLAEIGAAAASHTHAWAQVTGAPAYATRWPTLGEIGAQPAGSYAALSHTHAWSQVTGAPATATRWPTFAEVSGKPATYAPSAHTHTIANITSLQTSLDAKQGIDTQNGAIVASRYLSSGVSAVGTKIRLPFLTSAGRMVCFTVRVYQNYQTTDVLFSGYLYGTTNQWHVPKAVVSAGSTGLGVKMGRDADGRAYVWLQGGDYRGVAVLDVVGGYTAANWNTGWEISESNTVPNLALDTTIYPPYSPNNKPTPADIGAQPAGSYAAASHTHAYAPLTGGGTSGKWPISVTGSSASTTGNSATATTLQTARTINGVSFNGSANITVADSTKLPLAGGALTGNLEGRRFTGTGTGNDYSIGAFEARGNGATNTVYPTIGFHQSGLYAGSLQMRAGGDFSFYTQGGTVLGTARAATFVGALSGNSATATTLQTARTLTIGSKGKSFNGSANVAWSLAEIGAQPAGSYAAASHTHSWSQVTGAPVYTTRWPNWGEVSGKPATMPPAAHDHLYLRGTYVGGGLEVPSYFGGNLLKLQMLSGTRGGVPDVAWSDAIWASSYSGTDVVGSNVLVMSKSGAARIGFRQQAFNSAAWGAFNEIYHSGRKPTPAEIGAQPAGSYAAASHTHPWAQITGAPAQATRWPNSTEVGLGNVPNTVHTPNPTANTVAVRDSAADIQARLFRSNYAFEATITGGLAFRTNNTTDNYIRFCNNPTAIRTWLGAAAASHTHPWTQITGVPVQATRWPNKAEVGLSNVGNYASSTQVAINTHALRDGNGDLVARQFHGDGSNLLNLKWAQLVGAPVTALRWPNWNEVSGKPAVVSDWINLFNGGITGRTSRLPIPPQMLNHLKAGKIVELRIWVNRSGAIAGDRRCVQHFIDGTDGWVNHVNDKVGIDFTWYGASYLYVANASKGHGSNANCIFSQYQNITKIDMKLL